MNSTVIISAVLSMLAGIGIFLVACQTMSSNLEAISSSKLRSLFRKVSGKKLIGVGIGTVTTAAIQSSGATTVMVIGFVNAGIMTLTQAATVIYGANIGTTITGQIVALGMTGRNSVSTTMPLRYNPPTGYITQKWRVSSLSSRKNAFQNEPLT